MLLVTPVMKTHEDGPLPFSLSFGPVSPFGYTLASSTCPFRKARSEKSWFALSLSHAPSRWVDKGGWQWPCVSALPYLQRFPPSRRWGRHGWLSPLLLCCLFCPNCCVCTARSHSSLTAFASCLVCKQYLRGKSTERPAWIGKWRYRLLDRAWLSKTHLSGVWLCSHSTSLCSNLLSSSRWWCLSDTALWLSVARLKLSDWDIGERTFALEMRINLVIPRF